MLERHSAPRYDPSIASDVGRVGRQLPQTAETYRYKVGSKFPADYLARVETAFRAFFQARSPEKLDGKAK